MGCVVVYVRESNSTDDRPLWVKCKDQGNVWKKAQVSIITQAEYKVHNKLSYTYICFCGRLIVGFAVILRRTVGGCD